MAAKTFVLVAPPSLAFLSQCEPALLQSLFCIYGVVGEFIRWRS